MKTLCAELKPLSRPYRHCFVRLLASYRLLRLAKLFVNPRYVICFFYAFSVMCLVREVEKARGSSVKMCLMLHIGYE